MGGKQIYLKVSSDYPGFFGNVQKYVDLINHQMNVETKGGFYVEIVEDGLIYIYNDFATYKKTNQQFSPQQITHFLQTHEAIIPPENLMKGIITRENFPKGGITITFLAQTEPKDKYLFIKEAHLRSFLIKGVSIHSKSADDLIVVFHTYDSLLFYYKFIVALFGGLSQLPQTSSLNINQK